jgi:hypothetical protein
MRPACETSRACKLGCALQAETQFAGNVQFFSRYSSNIGFPLSRERRGLNWIPACTAMTGAILNLDPSDWPFMHAADGHLAAMNRA